jgi:hypothetical protein
VIKIFKQITIRPDINMKTIVLTLLKAAFLIPLTAQALTQRQLVFPRGWNHPYGAIVIYDNGYEARVRSNVPPYRDSVFAYKDLAVVDQVSPEGLKVGDKVIYSALTAFEVSKDGKVEVQEIMEEREGKVLAIFPDGTLQVEDSAPYTLAVNLPKAKNNPFYESRNVIKMLYLPAGVAQKLFGGCAGGF